MADKIQKNVYDDVLPPRSRILNKYYFESRACCYWRRSDCNISAWRT